MSLVASTHVATVDTGPTIPTSAYDCANCYTIAHSYSNVPFQQCAAQCHDVDGSTLSCIQHAVSKNAYVLPEHIGCVNQATARAPAPKDECQTLCLAQYNNCVGSAADRSQPCVPTLNHCYGQCAGH